MPAPICPAPTTSTRSNFTAKDLTLPFVRIRKAVSGDAEGIAGVQERTWQTAYRHVFPARELERGGFIQPGRWRDRIADPPAGWATFVAEHDGVVTGFVSVGPSRDERGVGELYAIYVEPASWSTGTGRALIERAEAELCSAYVEATLWVLEDNPRAREFYERAGWAPDGKRKAEVRWGVRAPEVRYRKSLPGV
jgi:GNAT superfamily N-acetyltransferase